VVIGAAYEGNMDIGGGLKVSVRMFSSAGLDIYMMKPRSVETAHGTGSDEQDMYWPDEFNQSDVFM
jgi:hypothetical protein